MSKELDRIIVRLADRVEKGLYPITLRVDNELNEHDKNTILLRFSYLDIRFEGHFIFMFEKWCSTNCIKIDDVVVSA